MRGTQKKKKKKTYNSDDIEIGDTVSVSQGFLDFGLKHGRPTFLEMQQALKSLGLDKSSNSEASKVGDVGKQISSPPKLRSGSVVTRSSLNKSRQLKKPQAFDVSSDVAKQRTPYKFISYDEYKTHLSIKSPNFNPYDWRPPKWEEDKAIYRGDWSNPEHSASNLNQAGFALYVPKHALNRPTTPSMRRVPRERGSTFGRPGSARSGRASVFDRPGSARSASSRGDRPDSAASRGGEKESLILQLAASLPPQTASSRSKPLSHITSDKVQIPPTMPSKPLHSNTASVIPQSPKKNKLVQWLDNFAKCEDTTLLEKQPFSSRRFQWGSDFGFRGFGDDPHSVAAMKARFNGPQQRKKLREAARPLHTFEANGLGIFHNCRFGDVSGLGLNSSATNEPGNSKSSGPKEAPEVASGTNDLDSDSDA